jgi:protein-tyrosine phosphatase
MGSASSKSATNMSDEMLLAELCKRPKGLTEVRRDGKDNRAIEEVIKAELQKRRNEGRAEAQGMEDYAKGCWAAMEAMHLLFLDDDQPENEKQRLDPDHWYENNLCNAVLFANLSLEGVEQLVPGRLFTSRMPRNIDKDKRARRKFIEKCELNDLRVVCVLTEPEEFKKYSGMEGLLDFYVERCGLVVYNRAIPDFQIPTSGDLMNNILDLTYHLSKGENCLIHCAGGSGRTGMVVAAIVKNLGIYDPVSRIRRVKSTYVETFDQELFLRNMPKAIDSRIVREKPLLAKAIAAEHLIQVFYTHGQDLHKGKKRTDVTKALDERDEEELRRAYGQTFDLVDSDGSGDIDQEELTEWLQMCGAELDLSKITEVMLKEGHLTRAKFAALMSSSASSSRRDYDIGG